MLDEQIDQLDDGAMFRLLTAPWEDLDHGEQDQARELAHRVGGLMARQRRLGYVQMEAEQRGRLLYGPKQHVGYVVKGFGEVGEADRAEAVSYWEQMCESGAVLRDPRFQCVQVMLMGQLARAFTAVRIAWEGLADVAVEDEGPWSVVDLVEMWALAPVFEGKAGARAIVIRDPHARLLVKEYSREPEAHSANGAGKVSSMQLLEVLAGLEAELFAAEDEVAVEWSEDYGTYVFVW